MSLLRQTIAMEFPRCNSCGHWRQSDPGATFGVCEIIENSDFSYPDKPQGDERIFVSASDLQACGIVMTRLDFGCVLFESK